MSHPSDAFDDSYRYIIAGAGIAGATAAFRLASHGKVLIADPGGAASGATGAAAGLVNPFMGRKANPTWKPHEALTALEQLLQEAGAEHTCHRNGVLRPARSEKQAGFFAEVANEFPDLASFLSASRAAKRFPLLKIPHGGLWIGRGCSVNMEALVNQIVHKITSGGHTFAYGWYVDEYTEKQERVEVNLRKGGETRQISTDRLLLCVGQGYRSLRSTKTLGLRGVKGQTITVESQRLCLRLPALSGFGYVVPKSVSTCIIGSTYEHDFTDLEPSESQATYLLEKASQMIPGIEEATVVSMRAGVRVFPPSSHLPWVGPLPGSSRVWFFGALGSRGLLTAPLISQELPAYFSNIDAIPNVIRLTPPSLAS